jgi:hypothetical protein
MGHHTGCGCNPMKYPKEIPPCANDLQTRRLGNFQWFAIPVTAKRVRDFVCMAILEATKPLVITPTVLHDGR